VGAERLVLLGAPEQLHEQRGEGGAQLGLEHPRIRGGQLGYIHGTNIAERTDTGCTTRLGNPEEDRSLAGSAGAERNCGVAGISALLPEGVRWHQHTEPAAAVPQFDRAPADTRGRFAQGGVGHLPATNSSV
jgi:hypothetical protein